jgi:predicted thioesterase
MQSMRNATASIVRYHVTEYDSVRFLAPRSVEFARKPDIMASARLLELCEWPCMEALRGRMAPYECSLGSRQYLHHCGPILIGADLTITTRCTADRGPCSEWTVEVHDGHERVGHASLEFVVVHQSEFEDNRVAPKMPKPPQPLRYADATPLLPRQRTPDHVRLTLTARPGPVTSARQNRRLRTVPTTDDPAPDDPASGADDPQAPAAPRDGVWQRNGGGAWTPR